MFDKLVDVLLSCIDLFYFVRVVDEWEGGVVLRFGRYHRTVKPGWHFIWPFLIERLITQDMFPVPSKLDAQSLTTADGVAVVVSSVVTWKAHNVRKVLLECGGHEEALLDSVTGVLAQHVTGANWADLVTEEFRRTITTAVKERARKWGIKVLDVQMRDVARCESLRLFQPCPPPAAG